MEGSGDSAAAQPSDIHPSDLLREITELKRSNQRLERAFVALSHILENQQAILTTLGTGHTNPSVAQSTAAPDTLRKEFERRLKRGRASIVKEKILAHLARTGPTELAELKFLFVDQLTYTSKASFYRYVSELSRSGSLAESTINGQSIITLTSIESQH